MPINPGLWLVVSEPGLNQDIDVASNTQQYPIGKTVTCRDYSGNGYGEAEFIYLRGTAGTLPAQFVVYEANGTTTRSVLRVTGPGAVSMSACGAGQFGWYQRTGTARLLANPTIDALQLYPTATPGVVDDLTQTGDTIFGARADSNMDGGFIRAALSHPYCADWDNG